MSRVVQEPRTHLGETLPAYRISAGSSGIGWRTMQTASMPTSLATVSLHFPVPRQGGTSDRGGGHQSGFKGHMLCACDSKVIGCVHVCMRARACTRVSVCMCVCRALVFCYTHSHSRASARAHTQTQTRTAQRNLPATPYPLHPTRYPLPATRITWLRLRIAEVPLLPPGLAGFSKSQHLSQHNSTTIRQELSACGEMSAQTVAVFT